MHEIRNFDLIQSHDRELVGGKGFGLAQLTQAGLPVPPGFCITVAAHQNLQGRSLQEDTALKEKVLLAFKNLNA